MNRSILPLRPRARGECERGERPCPWATCRHHLGSWTLDSDADETCSLDVADRGQHSLEDHARATEGVMCRKDEGVIDETPGAYKDIDAVMSAQEDLVEVIHTLKQVVCMKG